MMGGLDETRVIVAALLILAATGGAIAWGWRRTRPRQVPGIQPVTWELERRAYELFMLSDLPPERLIAASNEQLDVDLEMAENHAVRLGLVKELGFKVQAMHRRGPAPCLGIAFFLASDGKHLRPDGKTRDVEPYACGTCGMLLAADGRYLSTCVDYEPTGHVERTA